MELHGKGSDINGATPSSLQTILIYFDTSTYALFLKDVKTGRDRGLFMIIDLCVSLNLCGNKCNISIYAYT